MPFPDMYYRMHLPLTGRLRGVSGASFYRHRPQPRRTKHSQTPYRLRLIRAPPPSTPHPKNKSPPHTCLHSCLPVRRAVGQRRTPGASGGDGPQRRWQEHPHGLAGGPQPARRRCQRGRGHQRGAHDGSVPGAQGVRATGGGEWVGRWAGWGWGGCGGHRATASAVPK